MHDYRKLNVWRKAHEFVLEAYRVTARFPSEEKYGLSSQIRRAAVSVPANIVEGRARGTDPDLRRFLYIALGSAQETEYLLFLATELKMIEKDEYDRISPQINEVCRMLNQFIQKLSEQKR